MAQHLALLCLGEVGRRSDLSGVSGVDASINKALASDSEDVKSAASMALGGVACGNLGKYLPTLLKSIQVGVVWMRPLTRAMHCGLTLQHISPG